MVADVENVLIIYHLQILLASIHKRFFTDTVYQSWNSASYAENFINSHAAEQFTVCYYCVIQMRMYIFFCFGPVKVRKNTVYVYSLSSCIICYFEELFLASL